jgi:hypothetical protein
MHSKANLHVVSVDNQPIAYAKYRTILWLLVDMTLRETEAVMDIRTTATTLMRATEIFTDFFKRKPDMTNIDDVMELLSIQCDVAYAMENIENRHNGN